MKELLRPMAELAVVLPAAVLCYLPMKGRTRARPRTLALALPPLLLLWCALGGALCYAMGWSTRPLLLLTALAGGFAYSRSLTLSPLKSISVMLGVCGIFSCMRGIATVLDACLSPRNAGSWFTLEAGLFLNLLCWGLVALVAYPATHAARKLLDEDRIAQTWYVFWTLPLVFIGLNAFIAPLDYQTLYTGRMMRIYVVIALMFLGLLLLFYLMFYLTARGLDTNARLQQENQFLHIQTAQYEALRAAIAETRQARHDLRHHFAALSALADRGAWAELRGYLAEAGADVPSEELSLCDNPAVDAVAGHYAALCRREGVPLSCVLDLPRVLPVTEMDFCVAFSNLLENALEAARHTDAARRYLDVRAGLHGDKLVLLTVENAYTGEIRERAGVFQSSKRPGEGVGLQSVRRIAEKNGGYSNFTFENGVFRANVMLRGGS